eukprot:COSAG02_NODE_1992_length_10163_cov_93.953200_2_plen_362_part_00
MDDATAKSELDVVTVQERLAPFLGKWFEDKSHGDVSSLNTFLMACDWSWATRPLLCNAPNQMWVVQQHADDAPDQMRIGVELNALMQKLVQIVGAAPFVRYDCSGTEFEFELFTGVTGYGQVTWEGKALHLDKFIIAPSYVLECRWIYSIVTPALQPGSALAETQRQATCKADYTPSHDTAMAMSAGETGRVVGEVGEEWTQLRVQRGATEIVGHVPTSFLTLSPNDECNDEGGSSTASPMVEGVPPATKMTAGGAMAGAADAADAASEATRGDASIDVAYSNREELWCRQVNRVFKRAPRDGVCAAAQDPSDDAMEGRPWDRADRANLKGDAVPEMDHNMHQVWVRAQDGDGGVLGKLMR